MLSATGLHKAYGPTNALAGADFALEAGEIVAVMGPSGSGKSTLLHCLGGIVEPDSGRVEYAGRDIAALSDRERSALRRREFGFVFQFGQLVPELTCAENLALPLRLNGMKRRPAAAIAAEWLDRLGVTEAADKQPGEVSGGQSQRVAVGRALAIEPTVVFADEPTGALDSVAGEQVMELLTSAVREANAAVVLVTHEPRIAAYAGREVVIRDGKSTGPGAIGVGL